jgi:transposase
MPELWPNDSILLHDNAPAHKALSVKQFLAQKWITEMEHPPCSPDLAQWLLAVSENKVWRKGTKFSGYWRYQEKKVTTALKAVPQQETQKCFKQWQAATLG